MVIPCVGFDERSLGSPGGPQGMHPGQPKLLQVACETIHRHTVQGRDSSLISKG
jgi:hypothetical protein